MLDWLAANPILGAVIASTVIVVSWMARKQVHRAIRATFGAPAGVLRVVSARLGRESQRVRARFRERAAEIEARELEARVSRLQIQLSRRVEADLSAAERAAGALTHAANRLKGSVEYFDSGSVAVSIKDGFEDTLKREFGDHGEQSKAIRRAIAEAEAVHRRLLAGAQASLPEARAQSKVLKSHADALGHIVPTMKRIADEMSDAAKRFEGLLDSEKRKTLVGGASVVIPWVAAVIVLAIAIAGAALNYQLIRRPMAEIVGEGLEVGGVPVADLAAITLIMLEAAVGVILMESVGATKLLPVFSRFSNRMLAGFAAMSIVFLVGFSIVEVALAFTREAIILLDQDLLRAAAGGAAPAAPGAGEAAASQVPGGGVALALVAQALLGAAIPWILAIVAIPAETVIVNSRFIVDAVWALFLGLLAVLFITLAWLLTGVGKLLIRAFDLLVFLPVMLERAIAPRQTEAEDWRASPRRAPRRGPDVIDGEAAVVAQLEPPGAAPARPSRRARRSAH